MAYAPNESDGLWNEILEHHWKYVESEESMQKIELRRDLEELVEKRLGKVPPSEKFYLEDTRYVFASSVVNLDDFSAYKASIGFEAISQYANNLFVKPWRKEYKVIKMYSGFYQHEIAENLVNAEKLFQAMGYQLMPNKTLILEGPICPDQVMNVARDAITAYVECQIMKRIYCDLTSLRLSVDWIDIYNFRSYHTADAMQMVKQMTVFIQEKHHKKQQSKLRDAYGSSSAALPPASSCSSCNPYQFHVQQSHQQPPAPPPPPASFCGGGSGGGSANGVVAGSSQLYSVAVATPPPCSIHSQQHQQQQPPPQQQQTPANAFSGPYHNPHHHPHHMPHHHLHQSSYGSFQPPAIGTMPHSKSLDHYQDANSAAAAAAAAAAMYGMNGVYMQRHSIDQPYHYTPATGPYAAAAHAAPMPFDGPIDGMLSCGGVGGGGGGTGGGNGSLSCSNNHPYNVAGPRYPPALPYSNYAPLGPMGSTYMNGAGVTKLPNGGPLDGCYRHPPMNGYVGGSGYPPYRGSNNSMPFPNPHCQPVSEASIPYGGSKHGYDSAVAPIGPAYPPQPSSILSNRKKVYDDYDVPSSSIAGRRVTEPKMGGGAKKLERYHKNAELLIDYESDMLPEALVERNQQQQQQHHHHHYLHHQTSRNSRQSDFDSYEDEQQESNVSRRISNKNQDGIGCYETWNYVYQNLEKQGYNKDLGERGDFLAGEADSAEDESGGGMTRERRRETGGSQINTGNSSTATLRRSHNEKLKAMKAKAADKVDGIVRTSAQHHANSAGLVQKMAKTSLSQRTTDYGGGGAAIDDAVPPEQSNSSGRVAGSKRQSTGGINGTGGMIGVAAANKENNNQSPTVAVGGILVNHHHHHPGNNGAPIAGGSGKKKTATFDTGAATIINQSTASTAASVAAPSGEWNCNFCTFLNPDVKRICDMCSKSRDFRLDGAATTSNGSATVSAAATCV